MNVKATGTQGAREFHHFSVRILTAIFICALSLSGAFAQGNSALHESARAAQVRALNNSVLQLHGQVQENAASASSVRGQAAQVLAQRAAALQALIQEDPHAALTFAFSPELLADLAAKFPASAAVLENHVTLSGTVEHWVADSADRKSSKESWFLNAGGSRLSLYFVVPQRPGPSSGPVVTLEGVQLGAQVAVSKVSSDSVTGSLMFPSGTLFSKNHPMSLALLFVSLMLVLAHKYLRLRGVLSQLLTRQSLAFRFAACSVALLVAVWNPLIASAQTCSTTGVQNVVVLLVTFTGVTPPPYITQQSVYAMFFGPTGPSLDGYWREASYGQTSATGNVYGWYTLDPSYQDCTRLDLLRDAAVTAASNAGVNFQNYNRIFIVTTDFGCGWTGVAGGTCMTLSSPTGSFVASTSYLDAVWQQTQVQGAETAAHEGGHNFGLAHAQSRTSGSDAVGAFGAPGTVSEYGDPFSVMSDLNIGHYAAPHKAEILNWISSGSNYQVVQSSGTWTLQPLETNPAGLVALKIQRGTGNAGYYLWLEYRGSIGNYDSLSSLLAQPAVLVHYEDSTTGAHTQLADFTPGDNNINNAGFPVGSTWSDPYSDLSISVSGTTSDGATVNVIYGGSVPCTSGTPSLVASPLNPSIYPGQSATYAVSVTNNDSSGCASSTINLGSTEPTGWSTNFSSSGVTLSPGQTASVTMSKGAPNGTAVGTYAVNLSASNKASTATDTANATVVTPPSFAVSISLPANSFTRPGTVPITAAVTNGGAPASAAGVTFTVTGPNGSTSTQNATTGSGGSATWNFKLNSRSLAGTYSVSAQASLSSGSKKASSTQSAGSNVLSFTVQ